MTAIATRYDKLAANCLAFVKLAAIRIWLRACESTHQFDAINIAQSMNTTVLRPLRITRSSR